MDVAQLQDQLKQRAFLHDDPDAYLAGVRDAVTVITDEMQVGTDDEHADSA